MKSYIASDKHVICFGIEIAIGIAVYIKSTEK